MRPVRWRAFLLPALVAAAAAARILMQVAAMPPYAGLDEAWHVARVAFVAREHRQPDITERSIPPYIGAALRGESFRAKPRVPYESANYEAQQPSLYYLLAAPLAGGDPLDELRRLRLLSALFALVVVLATALVVRHPLAIAALIVSFPTWQTLVVRASNDALACALFTAALAITFSRPRRAMVAVEAIVWALAVATKLYVWPLAIAMPLLWRFQRGSRARLALVVAACALTALVTMRDLSARTRNPVGDFGFDPVTAHAAARPIDYGAMLRITLASMAWTSGESGDALRPLAMFLYVVPLIAIARVRRSPYFVAAAGAAVMFALAHALNAAAFIRQARAAGLSLPLGGKEGWYWYALMPLAIGLFARHPRLAATWIVAWDVLITECALFHDWAGTASPAHGSMLFRWGPLHLPFTAPLPHAALLVALRLVHLGALAAALLLTSALNLQESSSDDRYGNTGVGNG